MKYKRYIHHQADRLFPNDRKERLQWIKEHMPVKKRMGVFLAIAAAIAIFSKWRARSVARQ